MEKQQISREELERLLLDRLGKHPECRAIRVAVYKPALNSPHGPNWGPAFLSPGKTPVPSVAWQIAREIGADFDLAPRLDKGLAYEDWRPWSAAKSDETST